MSEPSNSNNGKDKTQGVGDSPPSKNLWAKLKNTYEEEKQKVIAIAAEERKKNAELSNTKIGEPTNNSNVNENAAPHTQKLKDLLITSNAINSEIVSKGSSLVAAISKAEETYGADQQDQVDPEAIAKIKVSTSTICENFEIIETVFAIETHKDALFANILGHGAADPHKAFGGVTDLLKKNCYQLGGDAVINCNFNWEVGVSSDVFGISIPGFSRKLHMIYAYGTAVKIIK